MSISARIKGTYKLEFLEIPFFTKNRIKHSNQRIQTVNKLIL
jgi:hypothetical protein